MFGLFNTDNNKKDSKEDKLDNVTINKDGIVKLNLRKESVRKKVALEANKFKDFDNKLVSQ
jgi:predicted  nucleic acid-binding Zn-ribbon protein